MAFPGLIVGGQALQQDENNQFTNRHLAQIIAERAAALAQQRQAIDWQNRGRGVSAGQLFGPGAPPVGPAMAPFMAPTGPLPQAPMPGQASVPEQQPTGAPGGGVDYAMAGGPMSQAAPMEPDQGPEVGGTEAVGTPMPSVGWQVSRNAKPELGGTGAVPTPEESAAGIGAPPPPPAVPKGMTTLALISGLQKRTDLSPEDKLAAVEYLHPIVKAQEQEALTAFKRENEILKVGIAAMRAESDRIKATTGRDVGAARIGRMAAGAETAAGTLDLKNRTLDARLSGALPTGRAARATAAGGAATAGAGTDAPEALTEGGKKVAAELSRAGKPLPGGWSKNGIARGNAILNQMAVDEEGGPGSGTIASGQATYKADASSLAFQQKRFDGIEASSVKIGKDIKTLEKYLDSGAAGSVTLINKPINYLRTQFSDPKLNEFALAAKLVGVEYERMINGALLSVAQLHEGAREDAAKLINENMTPTQIRAVIPVMLQEIDNAKASTKEQLEGIRQRTRKGMSVAPGSAPAAAPGGGGAAVRAFATEAEAAAANLPKGTKITIGGKAGTWQ